MNTEPRRTEQQVPSPGHRHKVAPEDVARFHAGETVRCPECGAYFDSHGEDA